MKHHSFLSNPEIKPLSRRQFVRGAAAGVAGSFLAFSGSRSLAEAQGGVPASRLNRLAKGANVCQWFRFVRREDAGRFGNYITEPEAQQMRQMGLTHVRLMSPAKGRHGPDDRRRARGPCLLPEGRD